VSSNRRRDTCRADQTGCTRESGGENAILTGIAEFAQMAIAG
jgi:hypothetical protein